MNHCKIYISIIENRKNNPLPLDEYGEKHHIVPRSLGGNNSKENLVRLTAREHFICHALLAEMYEMESAEWHKMNHAFMMMRAKTNDQKRYFNSRLYEYKRKDFSKALSFSQSGCKNSMFGKTRSEEEKAKISKSLKKRRTSSTKRDLKKQRGEELRKAQKARALELWQLFITSGFSSLREFSRAENVWQPWLSTIFKKHIPEYNLFLERVSLKKQLISL